VVSHLVTASTNVASPQKKNQRPADDLGTTDSGQPGHNVMVPTDPLSFAVAVSDVDHVKASVVTWMKFKMLNVILKDVATITHGLPGVLAVLHVVVDIKNALSLIAMVWPFKSIVKDVSILLSLLNGLNGVPAVLNVVTVS